MTSSCLYGDADRAGECRAGRSGSAGGKQVPSDFTHVSNLRNKTGEQGGGEKREGGRPRNRPLSIEGRRMIAIGGRVGGGRGTSVMGD